MSSYRAGFRFLTGGVKLLAAVALLGLAFFVVSAGGASAAEPEPPEVRSGTAQSNCQRIVDAGFSTDDYVLSGGRWQHRPDWSGADGARMSRIWRSVAICRGEYSFLPAPIRHPSRTVTLQPDSRTPLGANQGGPVRQTSTGSQQTIREHGVVEQREQEVEYQASHIARGPERDGKRSTQETGFAHREPLPRTPSGKIATGNSCPSKQARDCLTGQQWYDRFKSEHPKGGSYDPNYVPDDDHDTDQSVRRGNEMAQKGCLWDGTKYVPKSQHKQNVPPPARGAGVATSC